MMKGALGRVRPLHIALFVGFLTAAYTYLNYNTVTFVGSLLDKAELKLLDSKFLLRGRVEIDPGVVIAAGDERSLDRLGLWGTWDRAAIARIIDVLIEAKTDVVAFDMVFSDEAGIGLQHAQRLRGALRRIGDAREEERPADLDGNDSAPVDDKAALGSTGHPGDEGDILAVLRDALQGDAVLAGAFENHSSRVVQGFIANPMPEPGRPRADPTTAVEALDLFLLREYGFGIRYEDQGEAAAEQGAEQKIALLAAHPEGAPDDLYLVREAQGEVILPLPAFLTGAEYVGFFSVDPDPDGTMRRVPMLYRYGNTFLPSLALSTAMLHFGAPPMLIAHDKVDGALGHIAFAAEGGKTVVVPVDHNGALLVNYYGKSQELVQSVDESERGVFPRISLADVFCYQNPACEETERSRFSPASVQGKVVFVAVTAIGTYDQRVTPFSPVVPGVEVHAAAVQNLLRGDPLTRDDIIYQVEMILSLALALLLGFSLQRLSIVSGTLLSALLIVSWSFLDAMWLFAKAHYWFHQVPLILQVGLTWSGITVWGYLTEGREKALLKKEFSTVLAPTVVEELLKNPELAGLGGAERELTVMFSDIRGFTSISEQLSPQGLTSFLNEYLTPMTEVLLERQGTLDKYMGDAIMAFWGAPIAQSDHAARACLAALDMMERLAVLRARWRAEGKPDIDIGIGLNSGLMRVGFMGSERMRNYTLLGDNVNLGSRLEGVNKQYGTNIIISEYTYAAARGLVYARELDAIRVKGKREPVTIFELRGQGEPSDEERAFIDAFHRGLTDYKAQRFHDALVTFQQILATRSDDVASRLYVDRCVAFIATPPPAGWDGVYEMKTK